MSTSSGYVLAGLDLDKLEFWHWYNHAVRSNRLHPFRTALRILRINSEPNAEVWPIDL